MEAFKTLATQAEKLMLAAQRKIDLRGYSDSMINETLLEAINMLGAQISETIKAINGTVRIDPEQIEADSNFQAALEKSLSAWKEELEKVQRDQVEQAIDDARAGNGKSEAYLELEQREKDLKKNISEAEQKLGKVSERVQSPAFNGLVSQIVNNAKS